jgi:hypothetical protein
LEYRGQVESHETLPNLKKKGTESLWWLYIEDCF